MESSGRLSLLVLLIQVLLISPLLRCMQPPGDRSPEKQVYRLGAIFDTDNHPRLEAALQEAIRSLNEDDIENLDDEEAVEFEAVIRYLNGSKPFEAIDVTCELLQEGVVGILGPLSEQNSNVVQSVCDFKEIPHIEVRWDDHMTDAIINVHPYPDTLTKTYYDLITSWGWRHFVILYENDESLQRVGELLKLFGDDTVIVVRQLDPHGISDYRPTFKEVRDFGGTHFVLDCSIKVLNEVLVQAQQVGLMTDKHNFIITNLDLHTLDLAPYQHSKTNITAMRFVDPEDEYLKRTVCNMKSVSETDCFSFSNPLIGFEIRLEEALTFDAVKMFANAVRSIRPMVKPVPLDCYNDADRFRMGTTIINTMKSMDYPGITGNIRFDIKGFRSDFALDVMELKEDGQSIVGTWSTKKTPALNISRPYPKLDGDMLDIKNQTFRVIITLTEPYGMRVESLEPLYGNDQYEGFGIDLIKELSAMRGFNYTFIVREDKKNGEYDNKTGKWTGIIGDLIEGRADLAITDLTITLEREEAVDFTSPFMMLGISILYKKPTKAPPSFFSFADPFAFEVWQFLVIAWIGVSLLLFVVGRISPGEWENPYPCIKEPEYLVNQLDLRNCFWFVTGSIMQQGSEIELKSPPTRMVAGMWWFFTLLMVSSYTANLAAFLTTENPDPHFSNFHELVSNAESKKIKYGAKKGGATANFFRDKAKQDENSDFAKAWEFMEAHKDEVMVGENKLGVEKARNEQYAFFMESTSIEYEVQRKCELNQVGDRLDEKGYGIAMRKNSHYRNTLSTAILQMQNSGKIEQIKRKWWEERKGGGQCLGDQETGEATHLELKGVEGVFWVTIGGGFLAFFLAIIETILYAAKKSHRTKIPFADCLKDEVQFYFKFGTMEKQVIPESTTESSRRSADEAEKADMTYNGFMEHQPISIDTLLSTNSNQTVIARQGNKRSKSKSQPTTAYFNRENI